MTEWRKSSFSYANGCVEVAFVKSTYSINGNCVECAVAADHVHVRHSRDPDGPVLTFTPLGWQRAVLDAIRLGGGFYWGALAPLEFNLEEREAFLAGVKGGEFDLP